ncbi:hypothetical protein FSP39_006371 [Pinctada imbricata]|uniref:SRA1/Sec31 domain-containing protein n=1 Tax=Pinctada imbricata TaxID=66713 RepID=A0AA88YHK8_PINIB|nr:hypothetical protein FSP39_006371 [Pinctada imbricata]
MTGSSTQHDNQMGTGTLLDPASGPPKTGITILPPTSSSEAPSLVPLIVPSLSPPATQTTSPVLSNSSTKTEDLTMSSTLEEVLQRLCISSDEELLDCVVSTLDEGLEQVKTNLSVRAAEDVKKKLTTLTENWRDKKLSLPVRCRMGNISEALKKRKYQDAWNIHQTLIVDYTSEVNLWLVGVKRVIHELLQNSKEQGISSEGNEESPSYPTKEEDEQVKEPANEHTVISESTNQNQESSVDSKPLETESTSNELIKESKADTETL